jgi:hypothetical protein
MEAQRYPSDYDGVMAGAPALDYGFRTFVSDRLDAFRARGGKLVIYQGGADNPQPVIDYYGRVVARMGKKRVEQFMQLYVVDGMATAAADSYRVISANGSRRVPTPGTACSKRSNVGVEHGIAPRDVIATQYKADGDRASGALRTRPLCRYPCPPVHE